MGHDVDATVKIREHTIPMVRRPPTDTRYRSSFACILVPEKEREGVSPCSRGCILPPVRTSIAIES